MNSLDKMKDYELLEKQAAMMRMAEKYGIHQWQKLVQFYNGAKWEQTTLTSLLNMKDQKYRYAICVVEGKPVFEGDTLYMPNGSVVTAGDLLLGDELFSALITCGSWNPPKPKTVMVELSVDDAKAMCEFGGTRWYDNLAVECRKALEKLNE